MCAGNLPVAHYGIGKIFDVMLLTGPFHDYSFKVSYHDIYFFMYLSNY